MHDFGPGCATQEMVFVPRDPDASIDDPSNEDDGWIMSYVHDATTDTANVVILDAQDFSGEPVATVHLPQRVPFGFMATGCPPGVMPHRSPRADAYETQGSHSEDRRSRAVSSLGHGSLRQSGTTRRSVPERVAAPASTY